MNPGGKYKPFISVPLKDRKWPSNTITKAPVWCSVDLRDGNQALINPMGIEQKIEFFNLLVKIGFKEIEVGFPSASDTEFEFVRRLIEKKLIPDDVCIQVLCQAREHLIARTFEAIDGAKNVIFHIYNATSPSQRKYNFGKSKEELIDLAVSGVKCVKKYISAVTKEAEAEGRTPTNFRFEYSPENFTQTETDFAMEICGAVLKVWGATPDNKMILNLPATVECNLPNQFADQIEYFCRNFPGRENCIISLHNHNDRGEGIAQCELGLLAGAERVEGCLFGNGERTGNLDIVTVALNMYTQGVDPELDFSDLDFISSEFTRLTGMTMHPRSPYAGELVFTAFSGSHQDAIRKAINARMEGTSSLLWDVPYLSIDPHDIGREYNGIIRINSQSGKGGAAYILETMFGIAAPKAMHPVIGSVIKARADELQRELSPDEVYDIFAETWLYTKSPLNVLEITERHIEGERGSDLPEQVAGMATVEWEGTRYAIAANGNGPLDAFVSAMKQTPAPAFNITSFHEHSIGLGSDTQAMAYVQITKDNGEQVWGVGKSSNVGRAGIAAVVSALNFK
ncbi:2-isopropylmalate synthase [Treponema bryantii]|uniref:2-isopropylmalate synthase n=1 Tax=Treponema bryantii TaxID=163 RepID=A0A1H9HRV1_9SPIR|nr:2-isopropylmalate synthase [Treponema bryantii]SEQ64996.1 2-isopropylmalate synthase [Treponema bryantii]